jgi:hypothetical protein
VEKDGGMGAVAEKDGVEADMAVDENRAPYQYSTPATLLQKIRESFTVSPKYYSKPQNIS